jgi:hypothetical protein
MHLIRQILIGFIGLSLVMIAISSLLPNQVMNSRGVMIDSELHSILQAVKDLDTWSNWNVLLQSASQIEVNKTGERAGIGSRIKWTTSEGKIHRITVTEYNEKGIVTEMQLDGQRPLTSGFSVEKRRTDSVQVVWFIIEKLKWYPWEKFYGIMTGGMKGPYMEQSLQQLKFQLEKE